MAPDAIVSMMVGKISGNKLVQDSKQSSKFDWKSNYMDK
jgi:hypothetical protein